MAWTERYVDAAAAGGGDGTTTATSGANGAFTLAEAISDAATPHTGYRYNIKAGTYANTTTSRTFSGAGTDAAPIWWRGYNATAGDLDTNPTSNRTPGTDCPLFTFTTGQMIASGARNIFTNIGITSQCTTAGGAVNVTGAFTRWVRVRIENTAANSAARALSIGTSNGSDFLLCWFKATSTATFTVNNGAKASYTACSFRGSATAQLRGDDGTFVHYCAFIISGGRGLDWNSFQPHVLHGSIFYGNSTAGLLIGTAPSQGIITCNIFANNGTYGINNTSGGNLNITRLNNFFGGGSYANTSGKENGFGDSPSLYELTDSNAIWTNPGSSDFSLQSGSGAKGVGLGLYENETFSTYLDIGAVQRQEAGGGGGIFCGPMILNRGSPY